MKQITIISQNHDDLTAEIAAILGGNGINIETMAITSAEETSVINLTVDQYDAALQLLQDNGFDAVSEDALLIRVPDEPGSLAKVAMRFRDAGIHVRSLRIIRRRNRHAIVAVSVDRTNKACQLVEDLLVSEDRLRRGKGH